MQVNGSGRLGSVLWRSAATRSWLLIHEPLRRTFAFRSAGSESIPAIDGGFDADSAIGPKRIDEFGQIAGGESSGNKAVVSGEDQVIGEAGSPTRQTADGVDCGDIVLEKAGEQRQQRSLWFRRRGQGLIVVARLTEECRVGIRRRE